MQKAVFAAAVLLSCTFLVIACSSKPDPSPSTESSIDTGVAPLQTTAPVSPQSPMSSVLFEFRDPGSVVGWSSIDDSVMGGISASTTTWAESDGSGSLLFSGRMTTERNGGFTSTLGPADSRLGSLASGAISLGIKAVGDGRTYVLQLRAGQSGQDRWIARFTPKSTFGEGLENFVSVPLDSFEPVNRFLRPTTPSAPLDPATIEQIGIYLIDGQVGNFRLAIEQITAIR